MSKRIGINAGIATTLAICAVAISAPAAAYAQSGNATARIAVVEPGGGGH